jgi:hypothetical protein
MAADIELICRFGKPEYFFEKGWTGRRAANEVICPSGQFRHRSPGRNRQGKRHRDNACFSNFVLRKVPVVGGGLRRAARGGRRLILRIQAFMRQQVIEAVGGIDSPAWGRYRNRGTVGRKLAGQAHRDVSSRTEVGGAVLVLDCFDNERHVIRIPIQLISPVASHPRPGSV